MSESSHADWSRAMDCEVIDHGNDVTCHTLCGWFSEKLHRKLKINVIVKNKSTTIFHGLHSYRSQKWRHKTFKNLQWNHSPFDFFVFWQYIMFYDMGATSTVATIVGKQSISCWYFGAKMLKIWETKELLIL